MIELQAGWVVFDRAEFTLLARVTIAVLAVLFVAVRLGLIKYAIDRITAFKSARHGDKNEVH